jgi:hypothetical protein
MENERSMTCQELRFFLHQHRDPQVNLLKATCYMKHRQD